MREMRDSGVRWIGKIPLSWAVVPTKTLFEIYAGATPKSEVSEFWGNEVRWITPADYKTDDVYVQEGKRSLSKEGLESCSAILIPTWLE